MSFIQTIEKFTTTPLLKAIEVGLQKFTKQDTQNTLGDRSKYIGASDIGTCLKKAYLSKLNPVENDLKQMIIFQRGHLFEEIIKNAFGANEYDFTHQLSLNGLDGYEFINAHLDFLLTKKNKDLIVVECKSTSPMVDTPYESWILQVQLQLGLVKHHYKQENIRGYILACDLNSGEVKEFAIEYNDTLFNYALNRAMKLWNAIENKCEPDGELQLYCSKCPYNKNCSKLNDVDIEGFNKDIEYYIQKYKEYLDEKKEMDNIKKSLQSILEASGKKVAKSDRYTIQLIKNYGKESVDINALKSKYPQIYQELKTKSDSYKYIRIYDIN